MEGDKRQLKEQQTPYIWGGLQGKGPSAPPLPPEETRNEGDKNVLRDTVTFIAFLLLIMSVRFHVFDFRQVST